MKRLLTKLCHTFELGDHEYIRWTLNGPYPLRFWLTVLEPRRRIGWRRFFYWRLRTAVAHIIIKRLYSRCVVCHRGYTFRELLWGELVQYQSGTVNHAACVRQAVQHEAR